LELAFPVFKNFAETRSQTWSIEMNEKQRKALYEVKKKQERNEFEKNRMN